MLDVAVVGLGAVGTIYAYILERAPNVRVTAVCRSNHDVVRTRGIDIVSARFGRIPNYQPYRAVRSAHDAADRMYAFVICAFKYLPDVISTAEVLGPLLQQSNIFVLIQNGIGVHTGLQEAAGPAKTVLSGCAWIDITTVDEGRAVEHGTLEELVLGVHQASSAAPAGSQISETNQDALRLVVDCLRAGGGGPIPTLNINAERWRKNLWNLGFSTLCTTSRLDVRSLCSNRSLPFTQPYVTSIMRESIAIARSAGISEEVLPDSAVDATVKMTLDVYGEGVPASPFKPSMLVDLEAGRPIEVEGIVGGVMRAAREHGVSCPRVDAAYEVLKLLQTNLLASRSS